MDFIILQNRVDGVNNVVGLRFEVSQKTFVVLFSQAGFRMAYPADEIVLHQQDLSHYIVYVFLFDIGSVVHDSYTFSKQFAADIVDRFF